jgi:regulator of protease activity HflC (stomatin/prohibitin superfamily)
MFAASAVRILPEYERGVLFRLGRLAGVRGPGLFFIIPGVDRLVRVSLRTVVFDVPPQDVITRDNVTVKVSAVIYFRVMVADKAIVEVENYLYATSQLSQTTLRSVLGQVELDELLSQREKINKELQEILDRHTGPWGVKVSNVEVKNIDLPQEMQRAIAKQAEAERERRAKVIHAEGELQASEKLAMAAKVLAAEPASIQLRFLQALTEIATEKNSTIIFPVPIDLISMFMNKKEK